MTLPSSKVINGAVATSTRVAELFNEQRQNIIRHTDWLFSWLMIFQWFFAVGLALWLSPKTWAGMNSQIHPHIWAAIFFGGIITSLPVYMARAHPGETLTRHTVAVGQMLMSGLLIHLTGGRIETHFHVFGSLRFWRFTGIGKFLFLRPRLSMWTIWLVGIFGRSLSMVCFRHPFGGPSSMRDGCCLK